MPKLSDPVLTEGLILSQCLSNMEQDVLNQRKAGADYNTGLLKSTCLGMGLGIPVALVMAIGIACYTMASGSSAEGGGPGGVAGWSDKLFEAGFWIMVCVGILPFCLMAAVPASSLFLVTSYSFISFFKNPQGVREQSWRFLCYIGALLIPSICCTALLLYFLINPAPAKEKHSSVHPSLFRSLGLV